MTDATYVAFVPNGKSAKLRSLLETQRVNVAAHLEQARAIRGRL